ncbi:hypothetical protein CR194_09945 [Salipaludibacillus keqinensis]|uniref:Uncharacterized protein n=1 Tax=Salipaludibacillus keqinensis TaxID=2045207 RepID=A0A323TLN2_9BACI|nr:hypothetical protein [Salipaludibacillus keqinensis]PYZ93483.1 hypothetical protein CR194_09945 [Salipaludibacillus keqinensis]
MNIKKDGATQQLIQLQQKILHYKAELRKYKRLSQEFKKKLSSYSEKEKTDQKTFHPIESQRNNDPLASARAHFTYSTFLPDPEEEDQEILVKGHFYITNTGSGNLNHPIIGFRIKPVNAAKISGKIATIGGKEESVLYSSNEEWQHLHENWMEKSRKKGEYWLRPIHCTEITPNETLSFSSFDLRINPSNLRGHIIIEGFAFFDEIKQGVPAINHISFYL